MNETKSANEIIDKSMSSFAAKAVCLANIGFVISTVLSKKLLQNIKDENFADIDNLSQLAAKCEKVFKIAKISLEMNVALKTLKDGEVQLMDAQKIHDRFQEIIIDANIDNDIKISILEKLEKC